MLNLFKKTKEVSVYAPANGIACALSDVNDSMFAEKMLGDGFAVKPQDGTICAPCDGTIVMIANTSHAFGITTKHGAELLIHVGFDTINLQGEGLKVLVNVNDKVTAGTPILKLDMDVMNAKQIDLTTPVILTNGDQFVMTIKKATGEVCTSDEMMHIVSK